ncbi:MAG: hypothetical protein LBL73_06905 [Synergistaceae bacterium]|nr:hypothetical protein [Synergistaceae bacterium]
MVKRSSPQKKFRFSFMPLTLAVLLSLAVPADAHFLEGSWESDEFQYDGFACYSSITFDGAAGSFGIGVEGIPDYFFDNVEYGNSSVSYTVHDSWTNPADGKNGTMRYRTINDDTVEFEVVFDEIEPGYLRHRRVHYNSEGDTSLASGVGCDSGGWPMVFAGLIALFAGRGKKARLLP